MTQASLSNLITQVTQSSLSDAPNNNERAEPFHWRIRAIHGARLASTSILPLHCLLVSWKAHSHIHSQSQSHRVAGQCLKNTDLSSFIVCQLETMDYGESKCDGKVVQGSYP
ncbi:hypothetical protein PAXRUDRAFT_831813 [Paxillus rubicundulus Ve08.2h10]|uniref:Uncharacterized protein n=1 Tax=Paxillus rubicundulus Ve08.2h10 TaxID=930991 RepID=A0A0D0CWK2_9AGAM|nr:hypothetical protein PAXRUDRAFT_831813 [Paxillus rubicundulus Ve08.2h10]